MIDFAWREEISLSFGKIKRPVAEIYIKNNKKQWRALTMYIDSGADATVISRSFGELFGYNVNKGKKIRMKGFGEEEIIAYVHDAEFKIGQHRIRANIAIADHDKVPNVLGRKDIFDLFEIHFKNLKECTRFIRR